MATQKTGVGNSIFDSLLKGGLATLILTLFFLFYVSGKVSFSEILIALPFFILLYFTQFSMGMDGVIKSLQSWIRKNKFNALIFPTVMLVFYIVWLLINNQDILKGNPGLLLYIIYFPVVVFTIRNEPGRKIGWLDFTVFVLTLLPSAFFSVKQNSDIPISGTGFDSVSHVMIILSGLYAFGIVRGLNDIGFVPELKLKSFSTALLVWLAFYLLVFIVGRSVDFIAIIGYGSDPLDVVIKSIFFTMVGTFLHTALFEELFFRGILLNMLSKRIGQGKSWIIFWMIGFILLLIGAFLVGYTLEGKMKWFPALVTVILFGSAYLIEKSGKYGFGVYTSLAITGVTFGLVHYHAKSIIYIGFACVAGWAYGYTYLKTKNVFYSALVHTLVNAGVLIFGLKMMR